MWLWKTVSMGMSQQEQLPCQVYHVKNKTAFQKPRLVEACRIGRGLGTTL